MIEESKGKLAVTSALVNKSRNHDCFLPPKRMGAHFAYVFLILAVLQGLALAQFNLPVFVAEAVLNEQQHPEKVVELTETVPKADDSTSKPVDIPMHPKIAAGLKSEDKNIIEKTEQGPRIKREETEITRTRVSGVQRSAGRQADIDSFLSELEGDISRTQHTRKNAGSLNQAPSWSYKSPQTTEKSFWKRFGDSIGSTYTQVKTKTKDIVKGLQI